MSATGFIMLALTVLMAWIAGRGQDPMSIAATYIFGAAGGAMLFAVAIGWGRLIIPPKPGRSKNRSFSAWLRKQPLGVQNTILGTAPASVWRIRGKPDLKLGKDGGWSWPKEGAG